MTVKDNSIPIEAWNTVLFQKFCRFRSAVTTGLSGHSEELFRRHPYLSSARVLDVGCGFGDTTQQIARQVRPTGAATGVDASQNFIAVATQEAKQADIANASFFVADVQGGDLRGPYDHVFSRFGATFFNEPEVAFRNIRNALKAGGDLAMIVWRRREDNAWVHKAELLVKEMLSFVAPSKADQSEYVPGPFAMANADTASDILRKAGFDRIIFERYDTDICIGASIDDAVELAMAMGPAGEAIRLAAEEGEKRKPEIESALRKLFTPYVRADGIWLGSSSWFVRAISPGR